MSKTFDIYRREAINSKNILKHIAMSGTVNILVVEDDAIIRSGFEVAIPFKAQVERFQTELQLAKNQEAVDAIITGLWFRPDIIVMDGDLGSKDAFETMPLIKKLLEQFPHAILLAISNEEYARSVAVSIDPSRIIPVDRKNKVPGVVVSVMKERFMNLVA